MEIYVSKKTVLRNFDIKNGISKKKEWIQIEGVPCKIIKKNNSIVTLNSFTSSYNRYFTISSEELNNTFKKTTIDKEGNIINLKKYNIDINIKEFDERKKINEIQKDVKLMINDCKCEKIKNILNDKLFQIIQSQGSPYISITEYNNYKNGKINLSKHKRFGHMIFNRNVRWCPPINISYDEYIKSPSYPAPLGIRPKDFCLPSELKESIIELLYQINNFKNIKYNFLSNYILKYNISDDNIIHKCKYCGIPIDIDNYHSKYKSSNNYIEICHRDPKERFLKSNIYFGHGECNRKQGGYSEIDIIEDSIKLLSLYDNYRIKYKNIILDIFN
jgi:hypothetical protein